MAGPASRPPSELAPNGRPLRSRNRQVLDSGPAVAKPAHRLPPAHWRIHRFNLLYRLDRFNLSSCRKSKSPPKRRPSSGNWRRNAVALRPNCWRPSSHPRGKPGPTIRSPPSPPRPNSARNRPPLPRPQRRVDPRDLPAEPGAADSRHPFLGDHESRYADQAAFSPPVDGLHRPERRPDRPRHRHARRPGVRRRAAVSRPPVAAEVTRRTDWRHDLEWPCCG